MLNQGLFSGDSVYYVAYLAVMSVLLVLVFTLALSTGTIERAFDVKIDISLEKLPNIRNVSGKIRVNDGIDKALHILQYTADFSYKKNSETNVVTIY